jgi:hypothetical protein
VKTNKVYPLIAKLGIRVYDDRAVCYVKADELGDALHQRGGNGLVDLFDEVFGVHTCSTPGPYAYDVERTLARMERREDA